MANRFWSAISLVALAACARLLPHPANVTPVIAMALLSGAAFQRKSLAILIPLAAMFVSDLALGFHNQMVSVYGSIILISFIGFMLREKHGVKQVAGASIIGSLLFFAVTNFTVWISSGMYLRTTAGLFECYTLALPFLRNGMLGDLAFSGLLFGAWAFLESREQSQSLSQSVVPVRTF